MILEELERLAGTHNYSWQPGCQRKRHEKPERIKKVGIREVKYSGPATVIFWDDDTKTVSKCAPEDTYDKTTGFLVAWGKKDGYKKTTLVEAMDKYVFNETVKEKVKEEETVADEKMDQMIDDIADLLGAVEALYLLTRFLR